MKYVSIISLIFLLSCKKENEQFDLSFHNGWNRIYSYKLINDSIYYFQRSPFDTIQGIKERTKINLDSVESILSNVIADSIRRENYKCFDCGFGVVLINNKKFVIRDKHELILELFRISNFIMIDSLSSKKVDPKIFDSLKELNQIK